MANQPANPSMYVAFDLETTGLFADIDRIIEIGAVRFDATGSEHGRFEGLVKPDRPISPGARRVHGLRDEDLALAPPIREVLPGFLEWLGDPEAVLLLAHHARFDAGFLGAELSRLGMGVPPFRVADTLSLARRRLPEAADHKLTTLVERLGLPQSGQSHRALADSLRVKDLWIALRGEVDACLSYTLIEPREADLTPAGWEPLVEAVKSGRRVRVTYAGGTRGTAPRQITPKRLHHAGGVAYVEAICHLDGKSKQFRLDRFLSLEVLEDQAANRAGNADRGPALEDRFGLG